MAKTIEEERYRWIKPIIDKEMKLVEVAKICPHSERSLKRWKKAYMQSGMAGLTPKSTAPKTSPRETPIRIKELVIEKRIATNHLCAQKVHWKLAKDGITVPVSTIGKILKAEGLVKVYRTKKVTYKHVKVTRQPGELIEIDVKHVPGPIPIQGRTYYQYTAIDTASRWRHLEIFDEETTHHSVIFLDIVRSKFPHPITAIKTDNHATFTNYYVGRRSDNCVHVVHALDAYCAQHGIVHYLIDKGKPTRNGKVERSHGADQKRFYDQEEFVSVTDLKEKLLAWNEYYNNLEHCALAGLTPNEVLYGKVTNVFS